MTAPSQEPFFDVRMRGFRAGTDVEVVLNWLAAQAIPLADETVSLAAAAGRVLAAPIISTVDLPRFARSAMDGYTLRAEDSSGGEPLNVIGESLPARPFDGRLAAGEAVRIMTGAPIPAGADAVLRVESGREENGRVWVLEAVQLGRDIAQVGEDVARGQVVLPSGRCLRPQDIGLLAAIGVGEVAVVRRPRVAMLATGDELRPPGERLEGSQIVDSNSPMLAALVKRDGGECLPVCYVPDRYEAIRESICGAQADLILVSGGSSVGQEDHAPRALADLGELAFHGISLRPAAPTRIGLLPRPGSRAVLVVLLPGNPVSCLCGYDLFAGRAIRRLGGRSWDLPYRKVQLPLKEDLISAAGRVDYARVRIEEDGVVSLGVSGASRLSSAVAADGFVLVDRDKDRLEKGESVMVWLYD